MAYLYALHVTSFGDSLLIVYQDRFIVGIETSGRTEMECDWIRVITGKSNGSCRITYVTAQSYQRLHHATTFRIDMPS